MLPKMTPCGNCSPLVVDDVENGFVVPHSAEGAVSPCGVGVKIGDAIVDFPACTRIREVFPGNRRQKKVPLGGRKSSTRRMSGAGRSGHCGSLIGPVHVTYPMGIVSTWLIQAISDGNLVKKSCRRRAFLQPQGNFVRGEVVAYVGPQFSYFPGDNSDNSRRLRHLSNSIRRKRYSSKRQFHGTLFAGHSWSADGG